jgi:hypothetical protein
MSSTQPDAGDLMEYPWFGRGITYVPDGSYDGLKQEETAGVW